MSGTPAQHPRCVVVVGSGGREHALARRLAADPEPARVVVMPGNDGIAQSFECVSLADREIPTIVEACVALAPDLVVIGPESLLADGLADRLKERGMLAFGPGAEAARLEASKWFAKEIMREAAVPTAEARVFEDVDAVVGALDAMGPPWVLKADGLAGGKGVLVTKERPAATRFAREVLSGARFGGAGRRLVLERFLEGDEVSVMAVCDGTRAVLLPAARDFKRAYDGDTGNNTGGMGAISPVPGWGDAEDARVREQVVEPVLAALARRGIAFRGVLYCGLMLTPQGPMVLEFNVRFGDPEAQVILPRLGGSLYDLLHAAALGDLSGCVAPTRPGASVAVAIVDTRYPAPHSGEGLLAGTAAVAATGEAWMLFGGVKRREGGWHVLGGRAAYVCAEGATLDEARRRAYEGTARLSGTGWRYRTDIGVPRPVPLSR